MRYGLLFAAIVPVLQAAAPASGQAPPLQGIRRFNPFTVTMQKAWDMPLPDPVKLVDVAPVKDDGRQMLIQLVAGADPTDARRKLVVSHWDGFRFASDYTVDFLSATQDVLLAGHFREAKRSPEVINVKPIKGKKKPKAPRPAQQVVTNEGVYEWNGESFIRIFGAPTEPKLELALRKAPDELVTGVQDNAMLYEIGDTDAHASQMDPPSDGPGYVRFGIGCEDYPGDQDIAPGVRFAQSIWTDQDKWLVGVSRGKQTEGTGPSAVTIGDRIVVFTPTFAARDKSFWQLPPHGLTQDMEEAWMSDPLPGHILDVRIGDPKNQGENGILVLTSENSGKDRHLYFFTPVRT